MKPRFGKIRKVGTILRSAAVRTAFHIDAWTNPSPRQIRERIQRGFDAAVKGNKFQRELLTLSLRSELRLLSLEYALKRCGIQPTEHHTQQFEGFIAKIEANAAQYYQKPSEATTVLSTAQQTIIQTSVGEKKFNRFVKQYCRLYLSMSYEFEKMANQS
jgi:hypothetical protein